jgi:hypothetical protein
LRRRLRQALVHSFADQGAHGLVGRAAFRIHALAEGVHLLAQRIHRLAGIVHAALERVHLRLVRLRTCGSAFHVLAEGVHHLAVLVHFAAADVHLLAELVDGFARLACPRQHAGILHDVRLAAVAEP